MIHPHIERRNGIPYVRDSQVGVHIIWRWHRLGVAVATLVRRFPHLGPSRVLDALSFAYDNREEMDRITDAWVAGHPEPTQLKLFKE